MWKSDELHTLLYVTLANTMPIDDGLGAPVPARPTLAELFQTHGKLVWRVVAAHGVRQSDIADATQEVFVVALRRFDEWDPVESSAARWLHAIAIRVAANHRRRAYLRHESPGEIPEQGVTHDPTDSIERGRLFDRLEEILATMEPAKRETFLLFEVAEISMHEVATILGCPLKTAYRRLYAAREEVASRIAKGRGPR